MTTPKVCGKNAKTRTTRLDKKINEHTQTLVLHDMGFERPCRKISITNHHVINCKPGKLPQKDQFGKNRKPATTQPPPSLAVLLDAVEHAGEKKDHPGKTRGGM